MKKVILSICVLLYTFSFLPTAGAEEKIKVYVFNKAGEEISEKTMAYLKTLQDKHSEHFDIEEIIVWDTNWREDKFNRKLADNVAKRFDETIIGAPYVVVGSNYTFDEYSEELNDEIEKSILAEYANEDYKDVVAEELKKLEKKQSKDEKIAITILVSIPVIVGGTIVLARKQSKKKKDLN
ncbi:MAG: hypothetical protein IJO63_04755 [Bacilli bacterium]|nr:hypothetical protein [Bacilli bacterium]